jgi:hypothetical protein
MSVPGNQNAAKQKPWADALRRAMIRYEGGKENALNLIADQTVKLAVSGEQWAIKEIGDRTDGKAAQSVTVSGDDEHPLVSKVVREVVRAKD